MHDGYTGRALERKCPYALDIGREWVHNVPMTTTQTPEAATVAWISTEDDESLGVLYLMASAEGPVLWTGQIVAGLDDIAEFRDLAAPSRKVTDAVEGLTGKSVDKWELLTDGWYANLT